MYEAKSWSKNWASMPEKDQTFSRQLILIIGFGSLILVKLVCLINRLITHF